MLTFQCYERVFDASVSCRLLDNAGRRLSGFFNRQTPLYLWQVVFFSDLFSCLNSFVKLPYSTHPGYECR